MFQLLHDGAVEAFTTLDDALTVSRFLATECSIIGPDGRVAFGWTDRIGP